MSADLKITGTVITQSGTDLTPVAVKIDGTGSMPTGAIRSIAQETLAAFTGLTEKGHGFKVEADPSFHEQAETTITIFAVFKSIAAPK